jgi:hypothetical protein
VTTLLARRWLATVGVVAVAVAAVTTGVTYSAYSSATNGSGNRFAAGTVTLGDNDTDTTMLALTDAQPGATDTGCILVTYEGTLPASVRLHATVTGTMAPYLQLTVTRGTDTTPSFDACTGFAADDTDYLGQGPGIVYSGTLASYPASWSTAIADPPAGPVESWTTGEVHSYRLSVTLANDAAAAGTSATAAFTWEARNQ